MSEPSLRLFVAIDLPHEVKRLLRDLQTVIGRQTSAVRWTSPEGTHLTLKFLGDVATDHVPEITRRLANVAAAQRPFRLETAQLGVFPNPRRPRVVWLGVVGELAALARLQEAVEQTIAPLGFPTEERPFNPHLTLGRSVKQPSVAQLGELAAAVAHTPTPLRINFAVRELVLIRSELRPGGARYTPVAVALLDGTP